MKDLRAAIKGAPEIHLTGARHRTRCGAKTGQATKYSGVVTCRRCLEIAFGPIRRGPRIR